MTDYATSEIVMDFRLRLVIDIVSGPDDPIEYRCSIYDDSGSLISDGWGSTPNLATKQAMEDY